MHRVPVRPDAVPSMRFFRRRSTGRNTELPAFIGLDAYDAVVSIAWFRSEHLPVVVRTIQRLLECHLGGVGVERLALRDPQVEPPELIEETGVSTFAECLRAFLDIGYLDWTELLVPEYGLAIPARFEGYHRLGTIILHIEVDPELVEQVGEELAADSGTEFRLRGRALGSSGGSEGAGSNPPSRSGP